MPVFLIHGMGRTPVSMALLCHRLRRAGFDPHLFGYSVTFSRLDRIVERFVRRVERASRGTGAPYAVVGHSLGNVITRMAAESLPAGFERFVMLAPPNRSPTLARRLRGNPLFRLITGDAGQRLADDAFFDRLPIPPVKTLVVAGNAGPKAPKLPLGDAANDGVVRVDETHLEDTPTVEVPGLHTFLMNRRDVTETILAFLGPGSGNRLRQE